ncbi:predicted protein [Plenodomus lingam JN3]|uniref:Predicted protein n=1 Tax=Leptosphaeria maculans (strain JN3 / isolate v23.1.3 / race Av1-4-5-6-7-8) TaxID=985895 RepID=E4ZWW6_LEPMJ|nr:predicted protein [Plenodomus lingam JN3]CBX96092.1 predicted protein [Plenodomus lingam JN3]
MHGCDAFALLATIRLCHYTVPNASYYSTPPAALEPCIYDCAVQGNVTGLLCFQQTTDTSSPSTTVLSRPSAE